MTSRTNRPLLARAALLLLLALATSLGSVGCERAREFLSDEPQATAEQAAPAEAVDFEVDGDGVFYGTLMQDGRLHGADKLARIPLAERAAVVVHVNGKTPELAERYYVADLVDAAPGDSATATLRSADYVGARLATGEQAALQGLAVRDTVHLMAGVGEDEDNRAGLVRKESRASGYRRTDRAAPDEELPAHVKELDMKGEAIELFADTEITSHTGTATSSGGGSAIRINRINGNARSRPSTGARTRPIAGAHGWKPVTMYYAHWCGVCRRAKKWLDEYEVPYRLVNIDESKMAKAEMVKFAKSKGAKPGAVPTFRIDGDTIMQGWSPRRFKRLAKH